MARGNLGCCGVSSVLCVVLLSGCGTAAKVGSALGKGWDTIMDPGGTIPKVAAPSNALDAITSIGFYAMAAGLVCLVVSVVAASIPKVGSTAKHLGVMLTSAGFIICAGSYMLAEYSATFVWVAGVTAFGYGCFVLGNKTGVKLGFEQGKDFAEELEDTNLNS